MSDLKSAIETQEKELAKLQAKRDKATVKDYATIDKEILRLRLRIQRLKESETLQQGKGTEPLDGFTSAKVFAIDQLALVSEQEKDIESDPRAKAAYRLMDEIDRLELLKMASGIETEPQLPEPSDLTAQFEGYVTAKQERIDKARKEIQTMDSEIERIQNALTDATSAGNSEEIIEFSDSLETAKKNRSYLLPMLTEQENSETFPAGIIETAWNETSDLYRHELELRLEIIRTAQGIRDLACAGLIDFVNRLTTDRKALQDLATANGSPDQIVQNRPRLTQGIDTEWLRLSTDESNNRAYSAIYRKRSELL